MTIPTDRIEIDPKVCNDKPVIRGTRIPVSILLEQIAGGLHLFHRGGRLNIAFFILTS
jgi:uncharacterized protein (DUF433 family)